MVIRQDGYIELNDISIGEGSSIPADQQTTQNLINARIMQEYRGSIYLAYITTDTSSNTIDFHLTVSPDNGSTWQSPVLVFSGTGSRSGRCELLIHQDKIFYLYSIHSASSSIREMSVKVTPCQNWIGLSGVSPFSMGISNDVYHTRLSPYRDMVMLFWKYPGNGYIYHRSYRNGSWMGISSFNQQANSFTVIRSAMTGAESTYLMFSTPTKKQLRVAESDDGGSTWSESRPVANLVNDIAFISGVEGEGSIHIAMSVSDPMSIYHGNLLASGDLNLEEVSSFSPNNLDTDNMEVMISSRNGDLMLCYEDTGRNVQFMISREGGPFEERISLGSGWGHSPSIDEDLSMVCFQNGTDLEFYRLVPSSHGRLRTVPFSPMGLSSWREIGFTMGGLAGGSSGRFRILDHDEGSQLFPVSGYVDIGELDGMEIEGSYHEFALNLTGPWSAGEDIAGSLELEVEILRGEGSNPMLFEISLNYSVDYPYTEEMIHEEHIIAMSNCTMTPVGIELESGFQGGYVIIGPLEFDGTRPDHLSVYGSLLGNGNVIRVEILESDLETVRGFSLESSTSVKRGSEEVFVKWGRKNLHDIPSTFQRIFIKVHLIRGNPVDPILNWIRFAPSEEPSLLGGSIEDGWIMRGESTSISLFPHDIEDPPEHLDLEFQYLDPYTHEWKNDILSDPYWNGTEWSVLLQTDMGTGSGIYHFRARVTDGVGLISPWTDIEPVLGVKNNVPFPPIIALEPVSPRVGDDITISLVKPGSDLEVPPGDLQYNIYLGKEKSEGRIWYNLTEPEMVLNDLELVKNETWELRVTTWDGENESNPYTAYFSVVNSAPETTNRLPDSIECIEDEECSIPRFTDWFSDQDGDRLDHEIASSEEVRIEVDGLDLVVTPSDDFNGDTYMKIRVTDGEEEISINLTLHIISVNDAPIWNTDNDIRVRQGEWVFVDIGACDPSDLEDVRVGSDLLETLPAVKEGTNVFIYPNGSFRLRANNEMVGRHRIDLLIKDAEHELHDHLTIEVENINDDPVIEEARAEGDRTMFLADQHIVLVAEVSDPDLLWGDTLDYFWTSRVSGYLGSGDRLDVTLPEGEHLITLEVTDTMGGSDRKDFLITVGGGERSGEDVMRTWLLFTIIGVSAFLFSVMLSITVIILVMRRGSETGENPEEEKEDQKTGSEAKVEMRGMLAEVSMERPRLPPAPDKTGPQGENMPSGPPHEPGLPQNPLPVKNGGPFPPREGLHNGKGGFEHE